MTEWRSRYKGYGVMVYWHVETNAVCIYSQVKRFSNSEIAAMIEGLVRHDTEMRVEKNFVDSHGQSEVAFAFCHLLGTVRLMPRLKRLKYERLYLPDKETADDYPHLAGTWARPIRWDLVEQQYDEMIKAAVALTRGTATAEAILKRYNSYNATHPIRPWQRWAKRRKASFSAPISAPGRPSMKSTRGSTWWRTGTRPMTFCAMAVRVSWPPTAANNRRS
jgi:TnpA family transposase